MCSVTAAGPSCVQHYDAVCRTQGTIGMDWVYINTSRTSRDTLRTGMERVLNHTAIMGQYSPQCAQILDEYICISNYPSCDLSHVTPRPIMVSWINILLHESEWAISISLFHYNHTHHIPLCNQIMFLKNSVMILSVG